MAASTPLSSRSLWGEPRFSDATIIMGQKVWNVHLWVICQQSKYFEKALEGDFAESKTKTINLTGCQFLEEQVDGMLRYLYYHELDPRQQNDPIATFLVADYFQAAELRTACAELLGTRLHAYSQNGWFVNFKKVCHIVLDLHKDTHLEETVIKVIANNIKVVMYKSDMWDELTDAYPHLAKKVLEVIYAKPEPATAVKRPAGVAFDDTLQAGRFSKTRTLRSGSNQH